MKRIVLIALIGTLLLTFSACRKVNTGLEVTEENITEANFQSEAFKNTEDSAQAERTSSVSKPEASQSNAVTNENVTAKSTEITEKNEAFEIPDSWAKTADESKTEIKNEKIVAPGFELEVPKDFEVKTGKNSVLIENKKGTVQFNIEDKTSFVKNFDEYVSKTYRSYESIGAATSEIEEVEINSIKMKRFSMTLNNDGETLECYSYFAQVNGKIFVITLTSKNGIENKSAADAFVAKIRF